MIFVDTNFFLRFLLKDIKDQYLEAESLFKSGAKGEIAIATSLVVIFEIFWVLNSYYGYNRNQLSKTIKGVLSMTFIHLKERELLMQSIMVYDTTNLSLGDCYNIVFAQESNIKDFKTFDAKLNKEFEKIVGKKQN